MFVEKGGMAIITKSSFILKRKNYPHHQQSYFWNVSRIQDFGQLYLCISENLPS